MSILTIEKETTVQEHIFNILSCSVWEDVKQEVKALYQQIKNTLTEDEREELLLDIYLETVADDNYTIYWNFMNK